MHFSKRTIAALATMISRRQDELSNFPYKTGAKLFEFFTEDCRLSPVPNFEGARITWTKELLTNVNEDKVHRQTLHVSSEPPILLIIRKLLESVAHDKGLNFDEAINDVNRVIAEEGLRIQLVGGEYHFARISEAITDLGLVSNTNGEFATHVNTQGQTSFGPSGVISILFLAADPTDASRLRLGEELREIQEKLRLAKLRDRFELQQRMSVRPADISQALLDVQPRIVHFSGHGTTSGALCLEDPLGNTHPIQPGALAALFEQFANQVSCVLLNACYSKFQANAIAKHIDYVIGTNQAIRDKAAIAFAIGFYQALGAGRTIEEAYKLGCVQIRLQNVPGHLAPVFIKKQ